MSIAVFQVHSRGVMRRRAELPAQQLANSEGTVQRLRHRISESFFLRQIFLLAIMKLGLIVALTLERGVSGEGSPILALGCRLAKSKLND